MKVSVSLPAADVEFLDAYARSQARSSRSAVLHEAVLALRRQSLAADYADAWGQWEQDGDGKLWETTSADGI